jgi:hypothetical protein
MNYWFFDMPRRRLLPLEYTRLGSTAYSQSYEDDPFSLFVGKPVNQSRSGKGRDNGTGNHGDGGGGNGFHLFEGQGTATDR